MEIEKAYDPNKVEQGIYRRWEESGYFNPDNLPGSEDREPFAIMLPPPNVTGTLHPGHAFEDTLQDIVIRYQRMRGKRALWLPGTDHAAIATQARFEKALYKKEKKSRHDFEREEFFDMIHEFALENQANILNQLRRMGSSLDWSRLAFTLDEEREKAVRTAFTRMYEAGLIYRGDRIVNWDPKGQTTVSDDEVEYKETKAPLYTFRYSKNFPIPIATTRPETKVGDTAVAVHPTDERYKEYIGQTFTCEFAGVPLEIRIVGDDAVDPEYGTGAVGVTPAHSHADWDIAQRHDLPSKQVINEYAKMTVDAEELNGKKTAAAREVIVQWLRENGLMEKEEEIDQNLSIAQRTGGTIEPLPKLQWFIDVNKKFTFKKADFVEQSSLGIEDGAEITLKELMTHTVKEGHVEVMPDRFEKIYFHWIDNLRDWCISRQIIYGHRIPVWYKGDDIYVGVDAPEGEGWEQDTDTLDTWFSSGLWTFSTLGWPDATDDLKTYHPTNVMMPGYEILFFWVARMILMSGFLLGEKPFETVYLHGIVRDEKGRKFSKSLGNGIDPIEIIEQYGTDALRMALIAGVATGNDTNLDLQRVKGYKHFANKLWNIARFIFMNLEEDQQFERSAPKPQTNADTEILEKLATTKKEVMENLDAFRFHEAAQSIYHFTWHELADVYLEASKPQLDQVELRDSTQNILIHCLFTVLMLLHPFMPFVTEHIYSLLPLKDKDLLMVEQITS